MDDRMLQKCYKKAKQYSAKWKTLGFELQVRKNLLDAIEIRRQNNADHCMMDMLEAWLNSSPSNPEAELDFALQELQKTSRDAMQCNDKADELKVKSAHVEEIKQLKIKFASLTARTYKEFKTTSLVVNADDMPSVAVWLNEMLKGTEDEPLPIEVNVTNYDNLFRALQKKWGFTRPTFLQQLIEGACTINEALNQQMKEYTEKYNSFCSSLSLKETVSLEDYDPSNPCLILIFQTGTTFEDVEIFLREVFSIYKRYLRVHKIEPGSVKVIIQFSASVKPLLQACIDQKRVTIKHYKVKTMRIQSLPTEPEVTEDAVCKTETSKVPSKCQNEIFVMIFLIAVAFITVYVL